MPSMTTSDWAGIRRSTVLALTTSSGLSALAISSSFTPISTEVAAATITCGALPMHMATSTSPMSLRKVSKSRVRTTRTDISVLENCIQR